MNVSGSPSMDGSSSPYPSSPLAASSTTSFLTSASSSPSSSSYSFFFYDPLFGDELTPSEDYLLYFYPDDVPLDSQINLQGSAAAMVAFASQFTKEPINVVQLKYIKMAIKSLPNQIIMVLTSNAMNEDDATLSTQLDMMYKAFVFYNGTFADIFEQYKGLSRKELQQKFKEMGSLLIPLLHTSQKNIMRAFDPLPYTELPSKSARFFLSASQLLNEIKANPYNIAGVLFWDKSVLCTHLDVTTTRWILNLICIMKANSRRRDSSKRVQHVDDAERSSHHPFLTKDVLASLRLNPKDEGEERPAVSLLVPESPRSSNNFQHRVSRLSEVLLRPNDQGEYVGLYIICLKNISLAVLMNLHALHDTRHINTIKLCFSELFSLEQNLSRGLKTTPPNRRLFHGVSVKKPSNPIESSQKFYNFLMYDSLTGQAKQGTVPMAQKEVDRSFLHMTAQAHNAFEKDPELSQMLMRDNNGVVYCRRTLGKEVYYQQFQQQKTHYEFIHRIEKTVRNAIQDESGFVVL